MSAETTGREAVTRARGAGSALLVPVLFTFSGASALVYEVVWMRRFTFVFGAMSHSVATVLAAYMGGLALGSYLLGRRMARGGDPLRTYAVLEAGIGIYALLLPLLLGMLEPVYRVAFTDWGFAPAAMVALRLALSFTVLLVPTTLMGGTLPVLSALAGPARASGWAGLLYSLNTLGAVAGTALAGFVLLPWLGLRASIFVAVLVNLAVAAAAFAASRGGRSFAATEAPKARSTTLRMPLRSRRAAAMIAFALSGFAALAYEVLWTRVLAGSLGTTTYAFTTMLATFLLGLGIGSFWASRRAPSWADPVRTLGLIQIGAGLTALVSTPLLDRLPEAFLALAKAWGLSFGSLTAVRFVLASATMLPTTLILGTVFPAVVRLAGIDEDDPERASRSIGGLYAANTIGAIDGSVMTAFVLAPALGRQHALAGAALLNAAVGVAILLALPSGKPAHAWRGNRAWAIGGALAALALVIPARSPWNLRVMNAGSYAYTRTLRDAGGLDRLLEDTETVFMREDAEAMVSVWRSVQRGRKIVSLRINGKVDASTGSDMITQRLLGHLPVMMHPAPRRALVIGVASGVTVGAVSLHPLERIDCAEISPAVIEASRFFRDENHDALSQPNVRLHVTDGRNFLLVTGGNYDVITSEPSNPWITGITNLFTREFFRLARSHLEPGGIFCQWINLYDLSNEDLAMALRTFRDEFPTMSVWLLGTSDLLLLGGERAHDIDLARIAASAARPEVARDLAEVGVRDPWSFLSLYVTDDAGVAAMAGEGRRVTDDNLALEFSAPKSQGSTEAYQSLVAAVSSARRSPWPYVRGWESLGVSSTEAEKQVERIVDARAIALELITREVTDGNARSARLRSAYQLYPNDPMVNLLLAEAEALLGLDAARRQKHDEAVSHFSWALRCDTENAGLHYSMGVALGRLQRDAEAVGELEKAVELDPAYFEARADLGVAYANLTRYEEAEAQWNEALKLRPDDANVRKMLRELEP